MNDKPKVGDLYKRGSDGHLFLCFLTEESTIRNGGDMYGIHFNINPESIVIFRNNLVYRTRCEVLAWEFKGNIEFLKINDEKIIIEGENDE